MDHDGQAKEGESGPLRHVVVSDVHLGNRYCRHELFRQFLAAIPDGVTLVLNGDTIDDPSRSLNGEAAAAFADLLESTHRLPVVWIVGNHDDGFRPPALNGLRVVDNFHLDAGFWLTHGDSFDNVMPRNRWFLRLFASLHHLRMRFGAAPVHVAQYAKKWPFLMSFLRRNVRRNALQHAREAGYHTVACGHVHCPEDQTLEGIRYLNTGSWTDHETCCVELFDDDLCLTRVEQFIDRHGSPRSS